MGGSSKTLVTVLSVNAFQIRSCIGIQNDLGVGEYKIYFSLNIRDNCPQYLVCYFSISYRF